MLLLKSYTELIGTDVGWTSSNSTITTRQHFEVKI